MRETITLAGQTRFERNGEYEMMHETEIVIASGSVVTTVAGKGTGCAVHPPVTSTSRTVEAYLREVDNALTVTAYRNRPIQSRFKNQTAGSKAKRSAASTPDICPNCKNNPRRVAKCATCAGAGFITLNVEDQ